MAWTPSVLSPQGYEHPGSLPSPPVPVRIRKAHLHRGQGPSLSPQGPRKSQLPRDKSVSERAQRSPAGLVGSWEALGREGGLRGPSSSALCPRLQSRTEELHCLRGELSRIKAQVDRLLEHAELMEQQTDQLPGQALEAGPRLHSTGARFSTAEGTLGSSLGSPWLQGSSSPSRVHNPHSFPGVTQPPHSPQQRSGARACLTQPTASCPLGALDT